MCLISWKCIGEGLARPPCRPICISYEFNRTPMTKSDLPTLTTDLYKLLEPHEPDVRQRAVRAAMVMLGGDAQAVAVVPLAGDEPDEDQGGPALTPKVKVWMRTHGITREQLGNVFHLDGGASEVLPTEAPGKNGKEKTI